MFKIQSYVPFVFLSLELNVASLLVGLIFAYVPFGVSSPKLNIAGLLVDINYTRKLLSYLPFGIASAYVTLLINGAVDFGQYKPL